MAVRTSIQVKRRSPIAHLSVLRKPASLNERIGHLSPSLHNSSEAYGRHLRARAISEARQKLRYLRDDCGYNSDDLYDEITKLAKRASIKSNGAFEDLWRGFRFKSPEQVDQLAAENQELGYRITRRLLADGWPADTREFWDSVAASVNIVEQEHRHEEDTAIENALGLLCLHEDNYSTPTTTPELPLALLYELRSSMITYRKDVMVRMAKRKIIKQQRAEEEKRASKAIEARQLTHPCLMELRDRIRGDGLVSHPKDRLCFTSTTRTGPSEVRLVGPLAWDKVVDHVFRAKSLEW